MFHNVIKTLWQTLDFGTGLFAVFRPVLLLTLVFDTVSYNSPMSNICSKGLQAHKTPPFMWAPGLAHKH
jgi:hypothetical protein